jgi:dihydrodipicolinate synthase/N-acetylneuraminate lyase
LRGEPAGVESTHRIGALMRELKRAQQAGDEDEARRIQDQIAAIGRPGSQA